MKKLQIVKEKTEVQKNPQRKNMHLITYLRAGMVQNGSARYQVWWNPVGNDFLKLALKKTSRNNSSTPVFNSGPCLNSNNSSFLICRP